MAVDLVIKFLLITLLVLQIIVLVHMLIYQIKRTKEDEKFWKQMGDAIKKQVDKYNNSHLNDEPLKLEEGNDNDR